MFLGAFGPSPPTERFTGLVANAVENEPFFMCLAIAVATLGDPGEVKDRWLMCGYVAIFLKYVRDNVFYFLI